VNANLVTAGPANAVTSPSLASEADAFELKFLLTAREAERVEAWARQRLTPDPHGVDGTYQTTTLYLDTPFLDVYHKSPGYRRSKYRVRRYGPGEVLHLERKKRQGDRVRKRRELLPLADLARLPGPDGAGTWFGLRVREQLFRPVCWIGYSRTAFVGATLGGAARLTLDRQVVGLPAPAWTVPARVDGRELLPDEAILELKFRTALPGLFRALLGTLPSHTARGSKYARCVASWDLARKGNACRTG
jgi:hypothetical protein